MIRLWFGVNGRFHFFDITPNTFGSDERHVYLLQDQSASVQIVFTANNKIVIEGLPSGVYLRSMIEYPTMAF